MVKNNQSQSLYNTVIWFLISLLGWFVADTIVQMRRNGDLIKVDINKRLDAVENRLLNIEKFSYTKESRN